MGIFRRVNQIRPNYSLFMIIAVILSVYAGNLSSEFFDVPTFGFAKPVLIGTTLGFAAIITVVVSYVATRL